MGPILWSPTGEEVFFTRWEGREIRGASLSGRTRRASWIPGLDDVSREGLFLDTGMLTENYRSVIRARVPGEREERNLSWLGRSVAADLSSDGKQLLLYEETRSPEAAEEEIFTTFLRATDGSDAVRLGEGRALALSPDGQWALVARTSPESHLALLPTGPGEARRLEGGGLMYRRARFFRDGKQILFDADAQLGESSATSRISKRDLPEVGRGRAGHARLARRAHLRRGRGRRSHALSGQRQGRARSIKGASSWDTLAQWSSDGRAVYGFGEADDKLVIFRLDLTTGRQDR